MLDALLESEDTDNEQKPKNNFDDIQKGILKKMFKLFFDMSEKMISKIWKNQLKVNLMIINR